MNDSSGKKKPDSPPPTTPTTPTTPTPPAGTPEQGGMVGAIMQFVAGMMPGIPSAPSQGARQNPSKGMSRGPVPLNSQQASAMLQQLLKLTIDVANGMWRIRRRVQTDSADGGDHLRGLSRHVETTWSAFSTHGLEVRDHTGEKYVAGMAMSVVAYQSTPGITFEKVLETVRPSIYFQDQLIQRGEVIVATPESMPEMDEPAAREPTSAAKPIAVEESPAAAAQDGPPSDESSNTAPGDSTSPGNEPPSDK